MAASRTCSASAKSLKSMRPWPCTWKPWFLHVIFISQKLRKWKTCWDSNPINSQSSETTSSGDLYSGGIWCCLRSFCFLLSVWGPTFSKNFHRFLASLDFFSSRLLHFPSKSRWLFSGCMYRVAKHSKASCQTTPGQQRLIKTNHGMKEKWWNMHWWSSRYANAKLIRLSKIDSSPAHRTPPVPTRRRQTCRALDK